MTYPNEKKSWKDLLPKDEEGQKAFVALLKLVQAAKETTRLPDGSLPPIFPAGDLVFELAKLHTTTMSKLAEIASQEANKLLDHTRQMRTGFRATAGHAMQVLVKLKMTEQPQEPRQPAGEWVTLRNKASTERTFEVPELIELVRLEHGKACEDTTEYGEIRFLDPAAGDRVLEEICVPAKAAGKPGEKKVRLSIPYIERLTFGERYRGHVILESATGGPSAEIIVELNTSKAPPPPNQAQDLSPAGG